MIVTERLLPRHSDGGSDVGNSSGYQESSTSDLSDTRPAAIAPFVGGGIRPVVITE